MRTESRTGLSRLRIHTVVSEFRTALSRRLPGVRLVVAMILASTAVVTVGFATADPEPALATRPPDGVWVVNKGYYDGVFPGATVSAALRNWIAPPGFTASYQWYRCDSWHAQVPFTTSAITVPADCVAVSGATSTDYTFDPDLAAGTNSDEGKFLTVFAEDNQSPPNRSLAQTLTNFVIINRAGGATTSDGLRLILANGALQIYRNNVPQIYRFGSNGPGSSGVALAAEGKLIVPENQGSVGVNALWPNGDDSWDSSSTEMVSEDLVTGRFTARTTFSKTFGGTRTYGLQMDVTYVSPNQVATIDFSVTVPAGATSTVRLFYVVDMALDLDDFGPGKTVLFGKRRFVGQYNATAFGGLLEGRGPGFDSWAEEYYDCVFGGTTWGAGSACPTGYGPSGDFSTPYPKTVHNAYVDAGVGATWTLGSGAGTYSRQVQAAFAATASPSVSLTYSQNTVGTGKQILTYLDVVNTLNPAKVNDVDLTVRLPTATYGSPTSTCDGTIIIDNAATPPTLTLTDGNLLTGSGVNETALTKCQIVIPTTFAIAGVRTVETDNLTSSHWTSDVSFGSLTSLLSEAITVTVGGPDAVSFGAAAQTDAATGVDKTTATINGQVTATGLPAQVSFCVGTDSSLAGCTPVRALPETVAPDDGTTTVSAALSGLVPGTRYYYMVTATNGAVTSGSIGTFTALDCWETLSGGNIGPDERVLRFTYSPVACNWPVPSGVTSARVLVVAGGGGGGAPCVGGGGGGGGLIENASVPVTGTVAVTVGQGGTGGPASGCAGGRGVAGGASSFGALNAVGGGGGGSYNAGFRGGDGGSGGGGGGGAGGSMPDTHYGLGGTGTVGQGNNGGDGDHDIPGNPGGGGGGAGSAGATGASGSGGSGGDGVASDISGSSVFYGAGGGGGSDEPGKGGVGGSSCGGNGATGVNASTAGSGFGCGGGGGNGGNAGSAGSNGVVIIRYTVPSAPTTTTTSTTSITTTTVGNTAATPPTSPAVAATSSNPSSIPTARRATMHFSRDSARLSRSTARALRRLAGSLSRLGPTTVTVSGYTCWNGNVNTLLSRRRATAVARFLHRLVPQADFVIIANGKKDPVASNRTREGRSANRRVVISWTG